MKSSTPPSSRLTKEASDGLAGLALALALSAAGLSMGAAACSRAEADEKKPHLPGARGDSTAYASASASVSALPSADIAPPAPSGRGDWDPDFTVPPLPTEASKAPDRAEWDKAPIAKEARVTYPSCTVKRIREWYRVACGGEQAIETITGETKDVTLDCRRDSSGPDSMCIEVYAIFPARRGDRRSFEAFAWSKWGPEADAIMTEQYLEGDPLPLISVQGIRGGF